MSGTKQKLASVHGLWSMSFQSTELVLHQYTQPTFTTLSLSTHPNTAFLTIVGLPPFQFQSWPRHTEHTAATPFSAGQLSRCPEAVQTNSLSASPASDWRWASIKAMLNTAIICKINKRLLLEWVSWHSLGHLHPVSEQLGLSPTSASQPASHSQQMTSHVLGVHAGHFGNEPANICMQIYADI